MPVRSSIVTIQVKDGVSHTVEVTTASLYETVAQGLAAIRRSDWVVGDRGGVEYRLGVSCGTDTTTIEGLEYARGGKGKAVAESSHKTEQDNQRVVEIIGTLNLRFKKLNLYYEAGWTDSFCHRRCMHEDSTLIEAAECGTPRGAGWYVLAVENGTARQLLGDEEDIVNKFRFQRSVACKADVPGQRAPAQARLLLRSILEAE